MPVVGSKSLRKTTQEQAVSKLTGKQQAHVNNLGYAPKSIPTFRSEEPKNKGILDTITDILSRGESGGTNAAGKYLANQNQAVLKGQRGDLLGSIGDQVRNNIGLQYIPDFIEGAFGDTKFTGQNLYDQFVDAPMAKPLYDKAPIVKKVVQDDAARFVGGIGAGVALDPSSLIPIGAIAKRIPGASKVSGAIKTAAFSNPRIAEFAAKYLGKGIPEEYRVAKEALKKGNTVGDEVAVLTQKLLRGGLDKREVTRLGVLAEGADWDTINKGIKEAVKAGGKIDQSETYRVLAGIDKAKTPAIQAATDAIRNIIDKQSDELVKLGKITPEMAAKGAGNYVHLSYDLAEQLGDDSAKNLLGGVNKVGLSTAERSPFQMKNVEELRAIQAGEGSAKDLLDPTQLDNLGSVGKQYQAEVADTLKIMGNVGKKEKQTVLNEIAEKYRGQLTSPEVAGDKFRDVALAEQKARGLIDEGSILAPQTAQLQNRVIQKTNFFNQIAPMAQKFETAGEATAAGFKQIPSGERYGELAGQYLPNIIADDVTQLLKPNNSFLKKATDVWKQLKLYSPFNSATNARNYVSNQVLNSMIEDGLPIYRQDIYATAAKDWIEGGKWYKEYLGAGGGLNSFAANEFDNGLKGAESLGRKTLNKFTEGKGILPGVGFGKQAFEQTEESAKLAQYIWQRKLGKTPDAAVESTVKALFDYSRLPSGVAQAKDTLIPFISFKYFAAELALDTVINRTGKITGLGKIKNAVEGLTSDQANERDLPSYIKQNRSNYVRTPLKDPNGNPRYLDLTYMNPFGDIAGGFEPQDIVLGNPFLKQAFEQGTNQNTYFGRPITEAKLPEDQAKDRLMYALEQLGPKSPAIPGSYDFNKISSAISGSTNSSGRRDDLPSVLGDVFGGVKLRSVDPATQRGYNENALKRQVSELTTEAKAISRNNALNESQKAAQLDKLKKYREELIQSYRSQQ